MKGFEKNMKKLLLITTGILAIQLSPAYSQNLTKEDVQNIIKDYITQNPEVILDSVEAYGKKQQKMEEGDRQAAIKQHLGWFENNSDLPVAGNPNGDVTIIEFFDYNCGYCKKALTDIAQLIGEDKGVKVLFIELPILGRSSEIAAQWGLAAKKQNAYFEYHSELMKHSGPYSDDVFINLAEKLKLDTKKLTEDANGSEIASIIAEKTRKGSEMGISGTPAFIIDGQLYGGYMGIQKMREAVKEARANKGR